VASLKDDDWENEPDPKYQAVAKDPEVSQKETSTSAHTVPLTEYEGLQAELSAVQHKAQEQWDLAVRMRAEMENLRRRSERDVENAHKYGTDKFAAELLPVIDSLEKALENAKGDDPAIQAMSEGLQLTLKMFESALNKFGMTQIDPQGQLFDPMKHEALSMLPNDTVAPNTVLHVVQRGYQIHDRLLRPARVVVSKANEG